MFYKKHAFYTARCILYPRNTLIYIIRCIYIVRNVPAIFSSTSCISNISRYQQKISFGIGQMSMLFLGKYISGFKLVNARKLTKNSKRSSNFLHAFILQKFRFCKRWPPLTFPELIIQEKNSDKKRVTMQSEIRKSDTPSLIKGMKLSIGTYQVYLYGLE